MYRIVSGTISDRPEGYVPSKSKAGDIMGTPNTELGLRPRVSPNSHRGQGHVFFLSFWGYALCCGLHGNKGGGYMYYCSNEEGSCRRERNRVLDVAEGERERRRKGNRKTTTQQKLNSHVGEATGGSYVAKQWRERRRRGEEKGEIQKFEASGAEDEMCHGLWGVATVWTDVGVGGAKAGKVGLQWHVTGSELKEESRPRAGEVLDLVYEGLGKDPGVLRLVFDPGCAVNFVYLCEERVRSMTSDKLAGAADKHLMQQTTPPHKKDTYVLHWTPLIVSDSQNPLA
ncbi:hypothetical protein BDV93DRAFT_516140 [Ceratobasidium sp. AG-I]|nr:hypothetical protein BDV93DRAFT_516140 [Ceratobasidium sp. AG-I]